MLIINCKFCLFVFFFWPSFMGFVVVRFSFHAGPAFWGLINPQWDMCNKGRRQSPINVEPEKLLFDPYLRPLHIDKHKVSEWIYIFVYSPQTTINSQQSSVVIHHHSYQAGRLIIYELLCWRINRQAMEVTKFDEIIFVMEAQMVNTIHSTLTSSCDCTKWTEYTIQNSYCRATIHSIYKWVQFIHSFTHLHSA